MGEVEELVGVARAAGVSGASPKAVVAGASQSLSEELAKALGPSAAVATSLPALSAAKDLDLVVGSNVVGSPLAPELGSLEGFLSAALGALRDGGVLLFRQDLKGSTGGLGRFTEVLDVFRRPAADAAEELGFRFHSAQQLTTSVKSQQNFMDMVWTLSKASFPKREGGAVTFRQFLDQHQYQDSGILAYEWIFGAGFISPGGSEENAKFVDQLGLKAGERVLDVGCGIGGNAFYTAAKHGAEVVGVDLSSNMLSVALERAQVAGDGRVGFLVADAITHPFKDASFDAVYSRDCIIHIPDKEALFRRFFQILKPGGRVVLTDYCVGEQEHSAEFKAYLKDRQYGLRPISTYVKALEAVGFKDVRSTDLTGRFAEIIQEEMGKAERNKAEFDAKFPGGAYDKLIAGWKNKVRYIDNGDHKWASFAAHKPASYNQL